MNPAAGVTIPMVLVVGLLLAAANPGLGAAVALSSPLLAVAVTVSAKAKGSPRPPGRRL